MSSARCPFFVSVTFVRPFNSCRTSAHLPAKCHKTQHKQIWGAHGLPSIHRWQQQHHHHFHCYAHYSRVTCILPIDDHQDDFASLPDEHQSSLDKREQSTVDNNASEQKVQFWTGAQFELMVGLVGYLLCMLFDLSILGPHFSLGKKAILKALRASVLFCMLFWAFELLPGPVKIGIVTSDKLFRSLFEQRGIYDIALFCMCVAIGEELMFRSCIVNGLCKLGLPPLSALVLSALIFGLFHAYSTVYVALASLAGFLFGAMYLQAGSLFHPVFVHFMYDFLTIIFMKLRWRFRKSNEEDEQQPQQQQQ